MQSYRAFRSPWWGQPSTPPSISVSATPRGTRVYASWNGATDVATWRVLAGPSTTAGLAPLGSFTNAHFESTTWVPSMQSYFAVQALDAHGNVLGTSVAVTR
jgi:hypothetical protein